MLEMQNIVKMLSWKKVGFLSKQYGHISSMFISTKMKKLKYMLKIHKNKKIKLKNTTTPIGMEYKYKIYIKK